MRTPIRLLALFLLPFVVAAFPRPVNNDITLLQQLFVLTEVKPSIARVGILWDKNVSHAEVLAQIERAGASASVKIVVTEVGEMKDLAPAFRSLVRDQRIDALWVLANDKVVDTPIGRKFLIQTAAEHSIPILAPTPQWVNEGAAVALKKDAQGISLIVNRAAAKAAALTIPEKYNERVQYLAAN